MRTARSIQTRLLESGHYTRFDKDLLLSRHFAEFSPHPSIPTIQVTPLIAGSTKDIRKGTHAVYRSQVEAGTVSWPQYTGLARCVRIEEPKIPPVYVIDNHHLAYFAWHEAFAMGHIQEGAILIHIDKHLDGTAPSEWSTADNLSEVADYVRSTLGLTEFILPAVAKGLFSQFWNLWVTPKHPDVKNSQAGIVCFSEGTRRLNRIEHIFHKEVPPLDLFNHGKASLVDIIARYSDPKMLALDIDLDAFVAKAYARRLPTAVDFADAARFLAQIALKVGVVTIATSPGFAHQTVAVNLAKQIVEEMIAQTA